MALDAGPFLRRHNRIPSDCLSFPGDMAVFANRMRVCAVGRRRRRSQRERRNETEKTCKKMIWPNLRVFGLIGTAGKTLNQNCAKINVNRK
jgi:hypothetical protein